MTPQLWMIRVLRWLPRTARFDSHLTDCAALAVIYAPWNGCEDLRFSHIFKLRPLPLFIGPDAERQIAAEERRKQIHVLKS